MSSSRSRLLTDAALAVRTLRQQSRSRRLRSAKSMEEQREIALAEAPDARLPTTRPIDRRWDQSRLAYFQSTRRPAGQDCTWSPGHGIVFGQSELATREDVPQRLERADEGRAGHHGRGFERRDSAVPRSGFHTGSEKAGHSRRFSRRSRQAYSTSARAEEDGREVKWDADGGRVQSDGETSNGSISLSEASSEVSIPGDEDYNPSQRSQDQSAPGTQSSSTSTTLFQPFSELSIGSSGSPNMEPQPDRAESAISDDYDELTFQIPPEQYRSALLSSASSMASFWSHKLYRNDQGGKPLVLYCRSFTQAEECAKKFLNESVLGFDIEWEPYANSHNIKQNVSLIQLAAENQIALFHIALFHGETAEALMPPSLKAILESPRIVKAGVNVAGDARRIRERLGIDSRALFELSHLYRIVQFSETRRSEVSKRLVSLAVQVQASLGLPLIKNEVRVSSWSRPLQTEQTDYAASDAYAGLRVFYALEAKRKKMVPMPPRPAYWEDQAPLQLGDGTLIQSKVWTARRAQNDPVSTTAEQVVDEEEENEDFYDAEESFDPTPLDTSEPSSQRSELALHTTSLALDSQGEDEFLEAAESDEEEPLEPPPRPPVREVRAPKRHLPQSPEFDRANSWATTWRSSAWNVKAGQAQLRAYHLWHEQQFDLDQVAALLGDPPLARQTVASYVMEALKQENLGFDSERLGEVLQVLPRAVHGRYQKVLDKVGS